MDFASPLSILAIAIGLGCDAFAVGLSVGARFCAPRQVFRLTFHFGLFQFVMPLLGWALGRNLLARVLHAGHWLSAAILAAVGVKMLADALRGGRDAEARDVDRDARSCLDPTRGWPLIGLSIATSLDALAVGIGMGIAGARLLLPAAVIGVTASLMTLTAMRLGQTLSRRIGRRLEVAGALLILAAAAAGATR